MVHVYKYKDKTNETLASYAHFLENIYTNIYLRV